MQLVQQPSMHRYYIIMYVLLQFGYRALYSLTFVKHSVWENRIKSTGYRKMKRCFYIHLCPLPITHTHGGPCTIVLEWKAWLRLWLWIHKYSQISRSLLAANGKPARNQLLWSRPISTQITWGSPVRRKIQWSTREEWERYLKPMFAVYSESRHTNRPKGRSSVR